MAIGLGTALTVLNPDNLGELVVGSALAVAGSVMPDMDIERSKGSQMGSRVVAGSAIIVALWTMMGRGGGVHVTRIVTAAIIASILTILGMRSQHRTATHSLLGIALASIPVYMVFGSWYIWFIVGYASHILSDMLNKKEVKVLYPSDKGVCFGLCRAGGTVDKALLIAFTAIIVIRYYQIIL